MIIKEIDNYIIYISISYVDLKSGKEYQRVHCKGDLPKDSKTLKFEIDEDDKIL